MVRHKRKLRRRSVRCKTFLSTKKLRSERLVSFQFSLPPGMLQSGKESGANRNDINFFELIKKKHTLLISKDNETERFIEVYRLQGVYEKRLKYHEREVEKCKAGLRQIKNSIPDIYEKMGDELDIVGT